MEGSNTRFLKIDVPNHLSENWGGTESLKAVCSKFGLNILIISEDYNIDTCYFFCGFEPNRDKCLIVAYRLDATGASRNHYDSVIGIDEETAQKLAHGLCRSSF